jgi:peroxin-4
MLPASKRLAKEVQALELESKDVKAADYIHIFPQPGNIFKWHATIKGSPDSVYDGYKFALEIDVPQGYPMVPPKIVFITKIFHPNIHFETGEICLDSTSIYYIATN